MQFYNRIQRSSSHYLTTSWTLIFLRHLKEYLHIIVRIVFFSARSYRLRPVLSVSASACLSRLVGYQIRSPGFIVHIVSIDEGIDAFNLSIFLKYNIYTFSVIRHQFYFRLHSYPQFPESRFCKSSFLKFYLLSVLPPESSRPGFPLRFTCTFLRQRCRMLYEYPECCNHDARTLCTGRAWHAFSADSPGPLSYPAWELSRKRRPSRIRK